MNLLVEGSSASVLYFFFSRYFPPSDSRNENENSGAMVSV